MFSLPYASDYFVRVNGKKVRTFEFAGRLAAVVAVSEQTAEYEVSIDRTVPGIGAGIAATVLSLSFIVLLSAVNKVKETRRKSASERRRTMLSRKITDGCEFVVSIWNGTSLSRKTYSFDISTLTGEIIEIGAVRYSYDNGALTKHSVFSEDIAPVIYTQLHYHVKKVTHKKNSDLAKGRPFSEVYADFRKFCGVDCILVGWGNSDPAMLKMNLRKFGMNSNLDMFFWISSRFSRHSADSEAKEKRGIRGRLLSD